MSDQTIAPFIDIAGVRYPLQAGGDVRPWLNYSPTAAFPDTITFGDASKIVDQRTRALVYTDWRGGMGEYQGANGQLPQQSFAISDCDTRFERSLILPPASTQLGANAALGASVNPWYVEYLGQASAKLLAWQYGISGAARRPWVYNPGTTTWSQPGGSLLDTATGFCVFNGYFIVTTAGAGTSIVYSTDGVTWSPGVDLSGGHYRGCCAFANLVWFFDSTARTLVAATTPSFVTATVTSSALQLQPGEQVQQLVVWKNPRNEPALHLLTNQRLLRYDWDLDTAVTPGFVTIHNFTGRVASTCLPRAYVHPRDQLLYVTLGDPYTNATPVDSVLQFALGSLDEVGPNKRGGIPAAEKFWIGSLVGGYHWLYGFAGPRYGTTTPGRVLVMNGLGGWHSIAKGAFGGVNGLITGGGYANGLVWFTTTTGYVYEMADPDMPDLPANLGSGQRSFLAGTTCYHELSWHGGGMENIRKVLQHIDVDARDLTDTRVVPTDTNIQLDYKLDVNTAWTHLTGINQGTPGPIVNTVNAGLGAKTKLMKFRVGLYSNFATTTPNVAGLEAHFIPKPREHYAYIARLDLEEGGAMFPSADSAPFGKTAQQLQASLLAAADGDTLVTVAWGGDDPADANYTSLSAALVKVGGVQDSDTSNGRATVTIIDLVPPASG